MKKLKLGLFFVALAVGTMLCVVFLRLVVQRGAIMSQGPLTIEALDALAVEWGVDGEEEEEIFPGEDVGVASDRSVEEVISTESGKEEVSSEQDVEVASRASVARGGRPALKRNPPPFGMKGGWPSFTRTLTREEKQVIIDEYRGRNSGAYNHLELQFTEFLSSMWSSVGLDEGTGFYLYDTAGVAYSMGNWEMAKQYFQEALKYPLFDMHRQNTLVRLAWLEEDAEVANRLLELACPPEDECSAHVLYEATDLAWRTESDELFDYSLARLRAEWPEIASQFDERPSMRARRQEPDPEQKEQVTVFDGGEKS